MTPGTEQQKRKAIPSWGRRLVKWSAIGCLGSLLCLCLLIVLLFKLLQAATPTSFTEIDNPIPPPSRQSTLGGGLDGFESPYIGHTGSWDGKGGAMLGASKVPDLDKEVEMGLRWTFMCVYWSQMEPDGPVDLSKNIPDAWRSLDAFVKEAHKRRMNILMQAPVVGGNAGGPPEWAGRRVDGKSAPRNMDALVDFMGKMAARYSPGGTLAQEQGWGMDYGVRAWEMDNEPESYFTNWKGQAANYAELVTRTTQAIKGIDPQAVILAPSMASGSHGIHWLEQTLDAEGRHGSPQFKENRKSYSIGPVTDVVSFHNYEGLDSFFSGKDFTITDAFSQIRTVFEKWENASPGFEYERKMDYWHTEGNFDFIGALSEERRAAWFWQFFTRAFAAGIRKVTVMDAKPLERTSVSIYVKKLPHPFPMHRMEEGFQVIEGNPILYLHANETKQMNRVWIAWAKVDTGDAIIELPINGPSVELFHVDGRAEIPTIENGNLRLHLPGDELMPTPVMVVENREP